MSIREAKKFTDLGISCFYPTQQINNITELQDGNYAVVNYSLYHNNGGKIYLLESSNFIYYQDNHLWKVECESKTAVCGCRILYNVKDQTLVVFESISECKGCEMIIVKVFSDANPEQFSECYTNFLQGNQLSTQGLANHLEGNDLIVSGLFNYVSGSDNLLVDNGEITVSGMIFSKISETNWQLTIPGDKLALILSNDYLLFPTQDRCYSMGIVESTFSVGITTVRLIQTMNCNDVPPEGSVSKVIPTGNFMMQSGGANNVVRGTRSTINVNDIGVSGSYSKVFGMCNVSTGSSLLDIHGSLNTPMINGNMIVNGNVSSYSFFNINVQNKPFNIAYTAYPFDGVNIGTTTLTRVGTNVICPLPDGFYYFTFLDAIKISPGPNGSVIPEAMIGNQEITYVLGFDTVNNLVSTYVIRLINNEYFVYFYDKQSFVQDYNPATFNTGYIVLLNDQTKIHGNENRYNGYHNYIQGNRNLFACSRSVMMGDDNIANGGDNLYIFGKNNQVLNTRCAYNMVMGYSNIAQTHDILDPFVERDVICSAVIGDGNNYYGSRSLTVGDGGINYYSNSLMLSARNIGSTTKMIGNIVVDETQIFNGFGVSASAFIDGMIYRLPSNTSNVIANLKGSATNSFGFNNHDNIYYFSFPDGYFAGNRGLKLNNDLGTYTLTIDGCFELIVNNTDTIVLKKYFAPSYRLSFKVIDDGGFTINTDTLVNNTCMFMNNNQLITVSGISSEYDNSVMLFVDQPDVEGFISIGMVLVHPSPTTDTFSFRGNIVMDMIYMPE